MVEQQVAPSHRMTSQLQGLQTEPDFKFQVYTTGEFLLNS